jgi:WD40 repeat protein
MNNRKLFAVLLLIMVYQQTVVAQSDTSRYTTAVAWSRDGNLVAVVGIQPPSDTIASKGYVSVYDVTTQGLLYHAVTEYGGYASVAWSPENRFLAIGSYDQTIKVIDLEQQDIIATLTGHRAVVTSVDWSPDGRTLVSTGALDQQVILWDMSSYQQISVVEMGDPWRAVFNPEGTRIAVGGMPGLYVFPVDIIMSQSVEVARYRLADGYIGGLDWNEDATQIAFGTLVFPSVIDPQAQSSAQLIIVDANTGIKLSVMESNMESIFGVSLFTNLASVHSVGGWVQVWNLENNTLVGTVPGANRYPSSVAFSPYGGRLAYGTVVSDTHGLVSAEQVDTLGFDLLVPDPSLERLNSIAEMCVQDSASPARATSLTSQSVSESTLTDFVAQVEALPTDAIPPACRADLLAVATAIQQQ